MSLDAEFCKYRIQRSLRSRRPGASQVAAGRGRNAALELVEVRGRFIAPHGIRKRGLFRRTAQAGAVHESNSPGLRSPTRYPSPVFYVEHANRIDVWHSCPPAATNRDTVPPLPFQDT